MSVAMMPADRGIYVQFELRPVEDRALTVSQGYPGYKDVEFAIITPAGGNMTVEKEITPALINEWRHGMRSHDGQADDRRPPRPHLVAQYDAWKTGLGPVVNGLDVKLWPGVTPAQVQQCLDANLRSVEDLADANEPSLARLGMGGRALKEKAAAYLKLAQSAGVPSEEITALKIQLEALTARLDDVETENRQLKADLPRRGRPPKEAA